MVVSGILELKKTLVTVLMKINFVMIWAQLEKQPSTQGIMSIP